MYHGEALASKDDQFERSIGRAISWERATMAADKDESYTITKMLQEAETLTVPESDEVKKPVKYDTVNTSHWAELYHKELMCIYAVESYTLAEDIQKVKIKTSKLDPSWSNPDSTFVTLTNTGNNYNINLREKTITIDYDVAVELYLALQHAFQKGVSFKKVTAE